MAVVNHAKIMDGLEQATSNLDKNEFIFSFSSVLNAHLLLIKEMD